MNSFSHLDRLTGSRAAGRAQSWRVVIAEDEALSAELLKRMLARLGHRVVASAQTGTDAVQLVRTLRPDIVLMDLRMPGMDGWTAMSELGREVIAPIVVVSALDDREALAQAAAAGASGFLTKPVRADDLERALELAVARFADVQELSRRQTDAHALAQTEALQRALEELHATQRQLVTAARRAAMASLARSLTHEINNALTPIIGYAQILELTHQAEPETVERLRQIVTHARQIAAWLATLRQLAANAPREPIPFSLNGVIQETLELYAERFARLGIAVETDLDPEIPPLEGFPDPLQEVLIHLIQNAVEALRGGGRLHAQSRYAAEKIELRFTDSGPGIAAADLPHVTAPGFSTKQSSSHDNSLGWGLFAARQIIEALHGTLEIVSPPAPESSGTRVEIRLPVNAMTAPNV